MKQKKITRLAIIGLGYWGPNFARVCIENEDIALMACCDLEKRSLAIIGRRYPEVRVTSDYRTILKDSSIEGVIVVTPPATHHRIVSDCLRAGKDVLVEKPVTLTSYDAEDLIRLAKKNQRILMVDHIFEFHGAIQQLKTILATRKLGKIFYLAGSYTALGPVRTDVNALWDLAPHFFYMLPFLLGADPLWITAVGQAYLKKKTEDIVSLTLGFPGGIIALLHVSWLYPYKVRNLIVVGSKKMAVFDDIQTDQKLKIFDKGAHFDRTHPEYPGILKVIYREGDILIPRLPPKEPLGEVVRTFIESIKTRQLSVCSGGEGEKVIRLLEAAQKSMEDQGRRIFLP